MALALCSQNAFENVVISARRYHQNAPRYTQKAFWYTGKRMKEQPDEEPVVAFGEALERGRLLFPGHSQANLKANGACWTDQSNLEMTGTCRRA
jgi:hypothetical protein